MIIVIGKAIAKADSSPKVLELSLEHVARSRAEDGCIGHTVSLDQETPGLYRFVEYWRDEAALFAHFAVPASKQFVADLTPLLTRTPEIRMFRSEELPAG